MSDTPINGLNAKPQDAAVAVVPELAKKQEEIENAEGEAEIITPAPVVAAADSSDLEAMSVKELQELLTTEQDFVGAETFKTKDQIIKVLGILRARKSVTPVASASAATVLPDKTANPTERKNWEGKRERTKKFIEAQPKIRTMIPLDLGEKPGAVAELQINGYKKVVPKGVYVDLPLSFADLVAYSYNQTAEAGKDFLLDRPGVDTETGKTVAEVLS
jgi:hypothetical protein